MRGKIRRLGRNKGTSRKIHMARGERGNLDATSPRRSAGRGHTIAEKGVTQGPDRRKKKTMGVKGNISGETGVRRRRKTKSERKLVATAYTRREPTRTPISMSGEGKGEEGRRLDRN